MSGFNITVNPNSNGLYDTITFNSTGTLHSKNIIKFESTLGRIEKGASYNISYTAPEFGAIKDQLGFTLENFTISPVDCSNNIKNLELLEGFIDTETSNKVYLKFKKPGSETPVNVGLPSGWPYNNNTDSYKFYVISDDETSILNTTTYDITLVKTEIKEGVRCVELTLDDNLKSNLNNVGVSWDSDSIFNTKRIIDDFGNETFNSRYDPNNTIIATTNLLRIQNRIDPITIRDGPDLVITSDYVSKYEMILKFKRQISGSNIHGSLHPEAEASDFSIINVTEDKIFLPNEIIDNNDGTILLKINFDTETFDNTINKFDELLLKYNGGKTIIDKFNNKLENIPDLRWNITNDLDLVGAVRSIEIKNENFNKLHVNYSVDICGNTVESDGSDFILSNGMAIDSAVLDNENKKEIIITLQNSPTLIIDTKDITVSSSETNNIKNKFGLKIDNFSDHPIIVPELDIVSIKAPNNKGGKEIIISFPNTNVSKRDVTSSAPGIPLALTQPFEDFSVSVVPNSNGTYITPGDIVFKAYLMDGLDNKNKLRLVAEKGQIQYGANYNISYTGDVIEDQYDSRLEPFITSPVLCQNLVGKLLFKEGGVEVSTPNKIKFNFKSIIPVSGLVNAIISINLKDNFNNYIPPVSAFVAHIENGEDYTTKNVTKINSISYNGIVGLEFELDEPIKHDDIVSVEWNNTNEILPIDKRIMDSYDNEAFDSRHDPLAGHGVNNSNSILITNGVDGIIVKEDANLSMNVIDNKTSVTIKFKRITSGHEISCSLVEENLLPGGDDFVILRNGVEIIPDELIDNNDGTITLNIINQKDDFSKVINKNDEIKLRYKGTSSVVDNFGNFLLNEKDYDIINNIELYGTLLSAENLIEEPNKVVLIFDSDICGNSINKNDFSISVPAQPLIDVVSVSRINVSTIELLLNENMDEILNSTVSLASNYSIRNEFGFKIKVFTDFTIFSHIPEGVVVFLGKFEEGEELKSFIADDITNTAVTYSWEISNTISFADKKEVYRQTISDGSRSKYRIIGKDLVISGVENEGDRFIRLRAFTMSGDTVTKEWTPITKRINRLVNLVSNQSIRTISTNSSSSFYSNFNCSQIIDGDSTTLFTMRKISDNIGGINIDFGKEEIIYGIKMYIDPESNLNLSWKTIKVYSSDGTPLLKDSYSFTVFPDMYDKIIEISKENTGFTREKDETGWLNYYFGDNNIDEKTIVKTRFLIIEIIENYNDTETETILPNLGFMKNIVNNMIDISGDVEESAIISADTSSVTFDSIEYKWTTKKEISDDWNIVGTSKNYQIPDSQSIVNDYLYLHTMIVNPNIENYITPVFKIANVNDNITGTLLLENGASSIKWSKETSISGFETINDLDGLSSLRGSIELLFSTNIFSTYK